MNLESKEKIALAASAIAFLVSAAAIKINGFSTNSVVNIQNTILRNMFLQSQSTLGAISLVVLPFIAILLALVFLTVALAVLAAYGYYSSETRIGAVAGAIGAIIYIAVLGVSITSAAFAIGVFLVSYYVVPLSSTYGRELKRWVRYRTGSNAVGKALFVLNIIIAAGVFVAVLANLAAYQESFRQDFTQSLVAAVGNAPGVNIEERVAAALNQAPLFQSYFRWLPVLTALGAWIILEFLRSIVLSNIAGAATHFMIRDENQK